MADTTLSYVNAPDITIDEAFVGLSGAVPTIGVKVTTTVESGGAFTANQVIEFTTTSANTAATFGTVSLGATRA